MLQQGPSERYIIETCIKRRQPLPDAIANAPQLHRGLDLYYSAFMELSTCRPGGFTGACEIPWTAIDRYAQRNRFTDDEFETLLYMIRRMDEVYLKHLSKKSPPSSKKAKANGSQVLQEPDA